MVLVAAAIRLRTFEGALVVRAERHLTGGESLNSLMQQCAVDGVDVNLEQAHTPWMCCEKHCGTNDGAVGALTGQEDNDFRARASQQRLAWSIGSLVPDCAEEAREWYNPRAQALSLAWHLDQGGRRLEETVGIARRDLQDIARCLGGWSQRCSASG